MTTIFNFFSEITMHTSNRHTLRKKKYVRENQMAFLEKILLKLHRKEYLERTRLRKNRDKKLHAKERN